MMIIMLFIYGDSHAQRNFHEIKVPIKNWFYAGITMFRIGRDNTIINFNSNDHTENDVLCFVYGEVDCRCHIQRQIDLGRNEDDIIRDLVSSYIQSLANNIKKNKRVILVAVIPPACQAEYERHNGKITGEFPFAGSDDDRARFTRKVNGLLKRHSEERGYIYFDPFPHYTRPNGTLKHELSDTAVHLRDTKVFLEKFMELYSAL
jgi:hypothetical protein